MTENDAKEYLKDMLTDGQCIGDEIVARDDEEAIRLAISALEELEQYREIGTVEQLLDMKQTYVEALSDWRQYRKVGTVEECRAAINNLKTKGEYIKQILWERNVAIQQLEEIGISLGEKMDSIKEIMEKQREKKPLN